MKSLQTLEKNTRMAVVELVCQYPLVVGGLVVGGMLVGVSGLLILLIAFVWPLLLRVYHRYFKTDTMEVVKCIEPWSKYAAMVGVTMDDMMRVYQETSEGQGVVHASGAPELLEGKYTVSLRPVGAQYAAVKLAVEEDVRCAAHGLLHGLSHIHKVNQVEWREMFPF